jgi:UDP:flavonoid glycosyltransferase YjiC (YdhE family)
VTSRSQVLFVPSNGVGLGHVSRLLAIARRLDAGVPVVFASLSPALGAIRSFGFDAEYIPSHHYLGGDHSLWDEWLNVEIGALLEEYEAGLLVYDGNNPTPGLIDAARSRGCRLAWVRRGMWGSATSDSLDHSDRFDLILEPGEIAESRDEGATARRRHEVVAVDPIRLLDEEELLSRDAAASRLGLDASRPAVLIQLGSGFNRNTIGLTAAIVDHLRAVEGLQIVIADWLVDAGFVSPWDDVIVVRGFPLAQYFRAFDFTVSAAGYNTFHDVIAYALPTLFIANRHPSMDDQAGRARFAQDHSAAFEMPEDELGDLPQLLQLFLNVKAREFLRQHCRKLARPNGAEAAARQLEGLLAGTSAPARAGRLLLAS